MEYFCIVVLLIFALFGFGEFLHIVRLFVISPKPVLDAEIVIKLHNDTAEKHVCYFCEQYCWHGKKLADRLVFDYSDLDLDVLEKCRAVSLRYGIKI